MAIKKSTLFCYVFTPIVICALFYVFYVVSKDHGGFGNSNNSNGNGNSTHTPTSPGGGGGGSFIVAAYLANW
jgi:hypothetical protein